MGTAADTILSTSPTSTCTKHYDTFKDTDEQQSPNEPREDLLAESNEEDAEIQVQKKGWSINTILIYYVGIGQ